MTKEVIYIDINDDITSLISKITQAEPRIIALVPSKQIALLQSVVNLQLLQKTAKNSSKYLVIITNNEALKKLAGVVKIPVAKTLQSKPEVPEIDALKIDGESDIINEEASIEPKPVAAAPVEPKVEPEAAPVPAKKVKLPNLKKTRRLMILAGFSLLLIGFLIWGFVIAPHAVVTVKASTRQINFDQQAQLSEDSNLADLEKGILHIQVHSLTKTRRHEFVASGDKEIGSKAKGVITVTRTSGTSAQILPAGSVFVGNSMRFLTTKDVTIPGVVEDNDGNRQAAPVRVDVVAQDIGPEYNLEAQDYRAPLSGMVAKGTAMTGGDRRKVKVVTQADYDTAKQELEKQPNDEALRELKSRFARDVQIIDTSLQTKPGDIKLSSEVDAEAPNGKATLEQEVDYKISGIAQTNLEKYLTKFALNGSEDKKPTDESDKETESKPEKSKEQEQYQKIYDLESSLKKLRFENFQAEGAVKSVRMITQVKLGPKLDENEVREFAKGKNLGELRDKFEKIQGIKLELDLQPFWRKKVPNNVNRIEVKVDIS